MWKAIAAASLAMLVVACAPGGRPPMHGGGQGAPREMSVNQSTALLSHARKMQAEQGCARAIPAYRVIAGFGEGYEIAQYELGECLLQASGESKQERALLREEALFWLRRAAWAGDPRAQGKLAHILSGAKRLTPDDFTPNPKEAMGWALVYTANGERSLYDLAPVYPEALTHMRAVLSADEMNAANEFAETFEPIKMALFSPPAFNREQGGRGRGGMPPGGGRGPGGGGQPPRR